MAFFKRKVSFESDEEFMEEEFSFEEEEHTALNSTSRATSEERGPAVQGPVVAEARDKGTEGAKASYGIDDAISLIRSLPKGNIESTMQVVYKTLSSAHISVDEILRDANKKIQKLSSSRSSIREAIKDLKGQIKAQEKLLGELESDLKETKQAMTSLANDQTPQSSQKTQQRASHP